MAFESASSTTASLAPGFRFHPTDEELIRYYLRRKVCGKPFRFDAISEIDIYKAEPWDLPGLSRLKTRDLEWYFFSFLDKKYGNGSRTNRATERGYWKTTGKDRPVFHKSQTVGMKKTLVFHSGRAPHGERTNWVMHEYRLVDEELEKAGIVQDAFVLCRVFQKSGAGPKNGEQYGAPFVEEEWEDDELVTFPKEEVAQEVVVSDDAYLDGNDLEQILDLGIQSEDASFPLNFYDGDNNSHVEESTDFIDDAQKFLLSMVQNQCEPEQPDNQKSLNLPMLDDMDAKTLKQEYIGEPSNIVNSVDVDYLLDEPFLDATDNPVFGDGAFLETNDLTNPIEADPSGVDILEEYISFCAADDDISQYLAYDSSEMMGSENLVSDQASLTQKHMNEENQEVIMSSQQLLEGHNNDAASSSKPEPAKLGSDFQYPFLKQASCMLESIPAPPAFASEFPAKDAALRLSSTSLPSSSINVTTGMMQIRNMTASGNGTDWLYGKDGDFNVVLSLSVSQGDEYSASSEPMVSIVFGKAGSAISRVWFYLIFLWILILSLSYKIGTCICAK